MKIKLALLISFIVLILVTFSITTSIARSGGGSHGSSSHTSSHVSEAHESGVHESGGSIHSEAGEWSEAHETNPINNRTVFYAIRMNNQTHHPDTLRAASEEELREKMGVSNQSTPARILLIVLIAIPLIIIIGLVIKVIGDM